MHFWPALTVISVTSCLTYRSNSALPGPASGPRIEQFSESASALNRTDRVDHGRVPAQLLGRGRRAGERQQVLIGEVVEQVAHAAAHQLQGALRQEPGLDHQLDQAGGQVGGLSWPA